MTPEVRAQQGASLSKSLMTPGPIRDQHLRLIDNLAKDKEMQAGKGAKLSKTLENFDVLDNRTAKFRVVFDSDEYQKGFKKRLNKVHKDKKLQARRLAAVAAAKNDPVKEARRKAGMDAYWMIKRARGLDPTTEQGVRTVLELGGFTAIEIEKYIRKAKQKEAA